MVSRAAGGLFYEARDHRYDLAPVSISTKRGDGGTTGLLFGGRVRKDSARIETVGTIDEAQAALGLARAEVRGGELDDELVALERGLWVAHGRGRDPA